MKLSIHKDEKGKAESPPGCSRDAVIACRKDVKMEPKRVQPAKVPKALGLGPGLGVSPEAKKLSRKERKKLREAEAKACHVEMASTLTGLAQGFTESLAGASADGGGD